MNRSLQYRQKAELIYVSLILPFVSQNQFDLDIPLLLHSRIQSPLSGYLREQRKVLGLSPEAEIQIESEVLQALLIYLQEVKRVRDYDLPTLGLDILEYKQQELGLQPETAAMLNSLLLSSLSDCLAGAKKQTYQESLQKYRYALNKALQRDGVLLKDATRQEVQRLQLILGIADKDVASVENAGSNDSSKRIVYSEYFRRRYRIHLKLYSNSSIDKETDQGTVKNASHQN